jgi:hypothetical protein
MQSEFAFVYGNLKIRESISTHVLAWNVFLSYYWQDRCECFYYWSNRNLTILGRQRDDDGQNKLLQINGSKDNSSYIINRMNLIQSQKLKTCVLWLGRVLLNSVWSCLRLKMQPLYKDVKICAKTMSKLFMYCNYSILFNDLLYW